MQIKASYIRLRYFLRQLPYAAIGLFYIIWELVDEQRTIKLVAWSALTVLILIWPLLFRLRLLVDVTISEDGQQLRVRFLDSMLSQRQMSIPIQAILNVRIEPASLFVRSHNELIIRTIASKWKWAIIADSVYAKVSAIDWERDVKRPSSLLQKSSESIGPAV